jgi:hypothetical protein
LAEKLKGSILLFTEFIERSPSGEGGKAAVAAGGDSVHQSRQFIKLITAAFIGGSCSRAAYCQREDERKINRKIVLM